LKPENVLLCLTDKEIREIARNGYLKQNKKKQNNDKENQSEKSITSNKEKEKEENPQIPIEDLKKKKKIDKKKRQKQKKKLAKQLIKQGLNEEQVKKKMNEFNEKGRKKTMDSVNTEEENKSILSDYSLNDLIEKPTLQSVPKYTYDEITDDFNLEFDIKDYSILIEVGKKLEKHKHLKNLILLENSLNEISNKYLNKILSYNKSTDVFELNPEEVSSYYMKSFKSSKHTEKISFLKELANKHHMKKIMI
jgi:hypothetical protein